MCFSNITITHSVYQLDHVNFFKNLLESTPECRKIVLLMFLIKNDSDFSGECGFLKNHINSLSLEIEKIFYMNKMKIT